jgi:peptidyl-tRNA hydrolase
MKARNSLLRKATLLAVWTLALLIAAVGQNPRGSLRGTVQDATGARVASAKIVAQVVDSSLRREATSEDRGEFRMDDLLPGNYRIVVSATGFAQAQADVVVAVSSVREVTVTLKAATPMESVKVFDYDAAYRSGQRGASGSD